MSDEPAAALTRKTRVYQVSAYIDADKLRSDLNFSPNDLDGAMAEQSSLFAHYGELLSKASLQVDGFKLLLETLEAKVYKKLRDEAIASGEKVTEGIINNGVALNANVQSVKRALNRARQIESLAKSAVEGMRHRRDMLEQMGWTRREEMKGEMKIAQRTASDEALAMQQARVLSRTKTGA